MPPIPTIRCTRAASHTLEPEDLGIHVDLLTERKPWCRSCVVVEDDESHVIIGGAMFSMPGCCFQKCRADRAGPRIRKVEPAGRLEQSLFTE